MAYDIRRSRILSMGLGDAHTAADTKAIAAQLQQLIASAPSSLQSQIQTILNSPGASVGQLSRFKVSDAYNYVLQNNGGAGDYDANYQSIAGAIAAIQQLMAGGAPNLAALKGHAAQDILALVSPYQSALNSMPSTATSQANAILARTTSAPTNTAPGIVKYYTTNPGSSGTYLERDYAFLAQTIADLQALAKNPPPPPTQTYAAPPPPAPGPATYATAPAAPSSGTTAGYQSGTQFSTSVYTPTASLPDASDFNSFLPSSAPAPTSAAPAPSSGDLINLPIIGEVTPLEAVLLAIGGYFGVRWLRGRS